MNKDKWNYGGLNDKYNMQPGQIWTSGDGRIKLAVHDLRSKTGLLAFMTKADCVFIDPPWNLGNVNSFVTKADGAGGYVFDFNDFLRCVYAAIAQINPGVLYFEIGKEYLADVIFGLRKMFKRVTFFNSTYYHNAKNLCYIVRATNRKRGADIKPQLDGMDEENIIAWICENEKFDIIGDFCMGRGLVGKYAIANGRKCVGTELNPKRLAVLVDFCEKNGVPLKPVPDNAFSSNIPA